VPEAFEPLWNFYAAVHACRIFGDLLEPLYIISRLWQISPENSRLGSSHIMLGSAKAHSNRGVAALALVAEPDSSTISKVELVELIYFYPCI
jgi:hypothetical protein